MKRTLIFSIIVHVLVIGTASASQPFTPEDVMNTKRVTSTAISPDGSWIAYTVESQREANEEAGTAYLELFLVSTSTKEIRPLVTGKERASSLAWRPGMSAVSFLSRRAGEKQTQVWMVAIAGGEPVKITDAATSITTYKWSPNGKRLAYVAPAPPTQREKILKDAGYEFVFFEENLKHRNLYQVEVEGGGKSGKPEQLTDDITVWAFEYSPNGASIAFGGSPQNLVDHEYMFQKIYLLDIASKAKRQLTDNPGKLGNYAFSPDGKYLAYNAALTRGDHKESQVFVIPVAGGNPTNLTPPRFRGHVSWVDWKDNNTVAYRAAEGIQTTFSTTPLNGKQRTVVLHSEKAGVVFDRLSFTKGMKHIACVGESPSMPGEVYNWNGKSFTRLTSHNPWLSERSLGKQEPVRYSARDGLEIEGLVIHPVGYSKGQTYPLIVVVHGGPEAHYSNGWLSTYGAPAHVLANKGYVVFYPNYRASTGYGVEFAAMGYGDAAGKEFDDIADGINYLAEQGIVDRTRVGLGGGSYGGFASAWFATYYTSLVRAVCMFVGISNNISKVGTTDIPWEEYYVHAGKHIEEMWNEALARSPIYHAHKSKTATLIMGGLADTRVHPTQSVELFRRMKVNGHPAVRLVQYPGEQHGNTRQPGRIDVMHRTLDWYDWYVRDLKPLDGPMPPLDISEKYGLKVLQSAEQMGEGLGSTEQTDQ
ncbi:MAG: S9 family peptidase [Bacteroidetes bacterium]|nr:S9 family peptidase [Bacteroidota bacterium]MCW5895334.1 S9 family peptidase [Bacteroidota bacterium]